MVDIFTALFRHPARRLHRTDTFELSFFEVNGRQHAVVRVLAFGVLEQLDVSKDVSPRFFARPVFPASDFPRLTYGFTYIGGINRTS